MKNKLKTIRSKSTLIYLAILLLGLLIFPISKTFSAGIGLTISASFAPSAPSTSTIVNFKITDPNGVLAYSGSLDFSTGYSFTIPSVPQGLYYVIFDPISGYTTPEPDAITTNDDWGNNYPRRDDPYQGRRVYYITGSSTTMAVTYRKTSELKQIGRTTAETLLYDSGGAPYKVREWDLLRGVASISVDGVNWQSSVAEILSIGTMAQAYITKTGSHYIVPGDSAEYAMQFSAVETKNPQYNATITDVIEISNGQYSNVSIDTVGTVIKQNAVDSSCSGAGITVGGGTTITINNNSIPKTVTFNLPNATRGCTFEVVVKLKFSEAIAPNTIIKDTATITTEGAPDSDTFTTLVVGAFTQETSGGDIYAKNNLNFGPAPAGKFGGKYIIGSNGDVQATSAQTWLLSGYGIRSGSTADFSPDACSVAGSACKAMNDNLAKLMKGKTDIFQSSINGSFPPSLLNIPPEGWVYYKKGDLEIGGDTTFTGKGTIIIEDGNLYINGNMLYNPIKQSILGIIVKNGSVIVDSSVTEIDAIFYIYSETGKGGGSFEVDSNLSGEDEQLTIRGAVISSGKSVSGSRTDAFILARRYVGNSQAISDAINQAVAEGKSAEEMTAIVDLLLQPAELFLYDSRIIVMPPPGFGGKIAGSL